MLVILMRAIPVSRRGGGLFRGAVGVIVSALSLGCATVAGTPIAADLRDEPIRIFNHELLSGSCLAERALAHELFLFFNIRITHW